MGTSDLTSNPQGNFINMNKVTSFRILNDLLVMIDGGNNAILVLLDLSAAFDTLDPVSYTHLTLPTRSLV